MLRDVYLSGHPTIFPPGRLRMKQLWFVIMLIALPALMAQADAHSDTEFFETKIRPLLTEHCIACHGEKKQKGGLRLDSKAAWQKGGEEGPVIVPGKSSQSALLKMVRGTPGKPPQMPPDEVLPEAAVVDLAKWVDLGAPDPRQGVATTTKEIDWEAARKFWAYQPATATAADSTSADHGKAIDRYIAAGLLRAGLKPVGLADKRTLIRRATFDLTGLPPTEAEVQAFEADSAPEAFAKVIDRLLASPAYGEHQARGWLDLARYGESHADNENTAEKLTFAWRYRDWAIEAFNKDVSYDRFVKLQLAADLMEKPGDDPADRRALGLLGLGAVYARPNDLDRAKAEQWDDRVDAVTRAFLGLTVSCARCHDHKFDPIPTQDYYSLAGIIANTQNATVPISPADLLAAHDSAAAKSAAATQAAKGFLQGAADRIANQRADHLADYSIAVWRFNMQKQDQPALKPDAIAKAAGLSLAEFAALDKYLQKGNAGVQKLVVWQKLLRTKSADREPTAQVRELAQQFQTMVKDQLAKPFGVKGGRSADSQKDWFGKGGIFPITDELVKANATPEWKTELASLEKAAAAAAAAVPAIAQCNGVADIAKPADLKVYIRGNPAKKGEVAPRRFLRILSGNDRPAFKNGSGRLELAEAIADAKNPLTARVLVNRIWQQHFGRGIVATASNFGVLGSRPTHPELLDALAAGFVSDGWSIKRLHRRMMLSEAYQRASTSDQANMEIDPENQWLWRMSRRRLTVEEFRDATLMVAGNLKREMGGPSGDVDDVNNSRRTVYGRVSRHDLSQLLRLFDFPDPNISSDRRTDTTLPQQALFLMNSPFILQQAKVLAARVSAEKSSAEKVRAAYRQVFARMPSDAELKFAVGFLDAADGAKVGLTRMERFAQAILASNEFFFVD